MFTKEYICRICLRNILVRFNNVRTRMLLFDKKRNSIRPKNHSLKSKGSMFGMSI